MDIKRENNIPAIKTAPPAGLSIILIACPALCGIGHYKHADAVKLAS